VVNNIDNNASTQCTNFVSSSNCSATTNNNTNVNIYLRGFGDENMDYIDEEARKRYLVCGIRGIVDMMDAVFFNEAHPENHNVQLKSRKDKLVKVFKPPGWKVESLNETVYKMYDKVRTEIQLLLEAIPQHDSARVTREIFTDTKTTPVAVTRAKARLVQRQET